MFKRASTSTREKFIDAIQMEKTVEVTFFSLVQAQVITQVFVPLEFGPLAHAYDIKNKFYQCLEVKADGAFELVYLREGQVRNIVIRADSFDLTTIWA